ncbi:MAG: zinc-ribbon domain-containing protein, partial [Hyphomicrobiaceae bacterium]|nr:zinc-ribbon domain-containing protein [Hyphomicrobiaceae bacterium]
MIIQCQGCAAKYFLPEDKVPDNPTKVRCPKCT